MFDFWLILIDMDNSSALERYYALLAAVLRLVASTFLHRGLHNEQIQNQIKQFLAEYRSNIVGTFKRYSGIGLGASQDHSQALEDIVKSYTALLSMTDFIEVWNSRGSG